MTLAPAMLKASAMRLLILTVMAVTVACSVACSGGGEFELRVTSADENYMSELARELDAAGVDFRVGRDGSIAYRRRDEDKVRAIDERVKKKER